MNRNLEWIRCICRLLGGSARVHASLLSTPMRRQIPAVMVSFDTWQTLALTGGVVTVITSPSSDQSKESSLRADVARSPWDPDPVLRLARFFLKHG